MIGQRVQIPASTDEWMQGDRYGTVSATRENSAGVVISTVVMDKSGRSLRFRADRLETISGGSV